MKNRLMVYDITNKSKDVQLKLRISIKSNSQIWTFRISHKL